MSSTSAWTANRADLVRELAKARAERDIATARLQAALAREGELKARHRERKARHRKRVRDGEVIAQFHAVMACATIPPDPNAELHRRTLIAALKEKNS